MLSGVHNPLNIHSFHFFSFEGGRRTCFCCSYWSSTTKIFSQWSDVLVGSFLCSHYEYLWYRLSDGLCNGLWCVLLAPLCNTIKLSQSWDILILVKIRMSIIRMWSFTLLFLPICISDFSSDIFLLLWVLSGWWCDIIKMFQRSDPLWDNIA